MRGDTKYKALAFKKVNTLKSKALYLISNKTN